MRFSSQTRNIAAACVFVLVVANAPHASAQDPFAGDPIPNGSDVKTNGVYREGLFRYFSQIVTHYENNTKDTDQAKEIGIKLLTEAVRLRCLVRTNDLDYEEFGRLATAAIEAGSSDPLVRQRYGRLRAIEQDFETARAVLLECDATLAEGDYPTIAPMLNSLYLCSLAQATNDEELRQTHFPKFLDRFAGWLQQESKAPENRRYLFDLAYSVASEFSGSVPKMAIVESLGTSGGIDPWVGDALTGAIEIDIAWEIRSSASAGQVRAGAWEGFAQHLQMSSERLQRAWETHPECPEAATFMITIATAGDADESPRVWFDRAVQAEMDYPNAYGRFANSLLPRWGGSHRSMNRFGLECLATKRFDTLAPLLLFYQIFDIEEETGRSDRYWRNEKVYAALREMFEGYRQAPQPSERQDMYVPRKKILTWYAAVALLGEHWEDARGAIDELHGELHAIALRELQVGPFEVSRAMASTGQAKEMVLAAEKLADQNTQASLDQAIEKLTAASQQNDDALAVAYFPARATMLREQRDFLRGEWTQLTFDETLSGWRRIQGAWSRESDTAAVGVLDAIPNAQYYLNCIMTREHKFQPPYLFSAEIEMLEGHVERTVGVTIGDVAFDGMRLGGGRLCFANINGAGAELGNADPTTAQAYVPAGLRWSASKYQMDIRVWPDSLLAFTNNEGPVATVTGEDFEAGLRFGFCVRSLGEKTRVRYSNVRIRKLPYGPVAKLAKHEEIVAEADKMLEFDPDDWFARWLRGSSHFESANYDAALEDFGEYDRLQSNMPAAHYMVGTIYAKTKRYAEAISKFKLAEQQDPTDHRIPWAWAELEMSAEDSKYVNLESALARSLQAEQMNYEPETAWRYRLTVAEIYAKLGDATKALNKVSSIVTDGNAEASRQVAAKEAEFRELKGNSYKSAVASLLWEGDTTSRILGIVVALVLSAANLVLVGKAAKSGRIAGVAAGLFAGAISLGVPCGLAILFRLGEGPAFIKLLAGIVAIAAFVGAIGGLCLARNKSSDSSATPPITAELLDSE